MAWSALSPKTPNSLVAECDQVKGVLSAGDGELGGANGRLSALVSPDYTKNPTAGVATHATAVKTALAQLVNQAFSVVTVQPWLQLVGDGEGHYRTLSPQKAVDCLAAKLNDENDKQMPEGNHEALAILISSDSMKGFSQALDAFMGFFDVPDLRVAQNRAKQLTTLEVDKWLQPHPAKQSHWHGHRSDQYSPCDTLHRESTRLLALAEGYDTENTTPIDELAGLISKKQGYLQSVATEWTAFQTLLNNGFDGSTVQGVFASGTPGAIANALKAPKFQKHSLCAGLLFIGDDLTLIRELFGL